MNDESEEQRARSESAGVKNRRRRCLWCIGLLAAGVIAGCSCRAPWWPRPVMPLVAIPQPAPLPFPPEPQPLTVIEKLQVAGPGWHLIGESVEHRPIEATLIGSGPRRVLLIGGIHGDEPEGLPVMEWFVEELQSSSEMTAEVSVLVIRNLNPDGTAEGTRTNARGVDLNRNFPAANWSDKAATARMNPGPKPASEPETRVAVEIIQLFRPERFLVMHATRGKPMNNFDGPGQPLARQLSQLNGYVVSDTIGYPTPGSLGSWAGHDLQIPGITLELPRGIRPDDAWNQNKAALRQMLMFP